MSDQKHSAKLFFMIDKCVDEDIKKFSDRFKDGDSFHQLDNAQAEDLIDTIYNLEEAYSDDNIDKYLKIKKDITDRLYNII